MHWENLKDDHSTGGNRESSKVNSFLFSVLSVFSCSCLFVRSPTQQQDLFIFDMQKEDRMRISARWTLSVVAVLSLGAGFLSAVAAADDKDIKGTVLKIADALEKN